MPAFQPVKNGLHFLGYGLHFYRKVHPEKGDCLTVQDYLIKCQTIAMFASIRDIRDKEVWQLKKLRAMGLNGLRIGAV